MLVEPMERLHRSRAVISLGVYSGLAGPIFTKFLKSHDAFTFLINENPPNYGSVRRAHFKSRSAFAHENLWFLSISEAFRSDVAILLYWLDG
jgi:hypothetical protein